MLALGVVRQRAAVRLFKVGRVRIHSISLLTGVLLTLTLFGCDDRSASSRDVEDGITSAELSIGADDYYASLFEAALKEVLARRADRALPFRARLVLTIPETRDAYSEAAQGPALDHIREALRRVAAGHDERQAVEGSRSYEISCRRQDGYPSQHCSMDHDALVLRVTPQRPEFVLGLENGDQTVTVKTSEQGLRDGRLWVDSHRMTFRYVDGEWRLVGYSLGQS